VRHAHAARYDLLDLPRLDARAFAGDYHCQAEQIVVPMRESAPP
jgi:hypothetical protein